MDESQFENADSEKIALTIAEGFQSLIEEFKALSKQQDALEQKLKAAHDQFATTMSRIDAEEDRSSLRRAIEELGINEWDENHHGCRNSPDRRLSKFSALNSKFRNAEVASRMLLKRNSLNAVPQPSKCPFTKHTTLESDFTTSGTQGSLQCPFAAKNRNGLPTPPGNADAAEQDQVDPIKAEFNRDTVSISSHSNANTNPNKCPIRFLDQHSPEEVAQYFENHKHEIPRSHEICVKRYQKNSDSIKQLDAKYGNLVSMIQGLGVKHKQYLPDEELNGIEDRSKKSSGQDSRSVKQWAEDVSHRSPVHASSAHRITPSHVESDKYLNEEDIRVPHFERPLREVRVGESPSRPWGISVPLAADGADGTEARHERASSIPAPVPVELQSGSKAEHQRQLSPTHATLSDQELKPRRTDRTKAMNLEERKHLPKPAPQMMVFHGPVFFGYSSDEVMQLLRSGTL